MAIIVGQAVAFPGVANPLQTALAAVHAIVAVDATLGAVLELAARYAVHRARGIEHDEHVGFTDLAFDDHQRIDPRIGKLRRHAPGQRAAHGYQDGQPRSWPGQGRPGCPAWGGSHPAKYRQKGELH